MAEIAYPRTAEQLAEYLKLNPRLRGVMPTRTLLYTFMEMDGTRIRLRSPANEEVSFLLMNSGLGSVHFHSEGFTRFLGRKAARYYYLGDRPWRTPAEAAHEDRRAGWDEILSHARV